MSSCFLFIKDWILYKMSSWDTFSINHTPNWTGSTCMFNKFKMWFINRNIHSSHPVWASSHIYFVLPCSASTNAHWENLNIIHLVLQPSTISGAAVIITTKLGYPYGVVKKFILSNWHGVITTYTEELPSILSSYAQSVV